MALTSPIRPILVLAAAAAFSPSVSAQTPFQEELRRLYADSGIVCLCRIQSIAPAIDNAQPHSVNLTLLAKRPFKGVESELFTIRLSENSSLEQLRAGKTYLLFLHAPHASNSFTSFVRGDAGIFEVGSDRRIAWPIESVPIRGSPRRLQRAEKGSAATLLPDLPQVIDWLESFGRQGRTR